MSILVQLLLVALVLAILYASFIHNREKYEEFIAILPDFSKLLQKEKDSTYVKVVVSVPYAHAEAVRLAIGEAGAGAVDHYTYQSFSNHGLGRYTSGHGANPMVGEDGHPQVIEQERIEVTVSRQNLQLVLNAIKKVHPYEETVIDVYPLEAIPVPEIAHSHDEGAHAKH